MSPQLDLLSDSPIARSTDPETSHLAAEDVTASGMRGRQQARVFALVDDHPGQTSAELAEIGGIDRYIAGRRLPELRAAKLVRNGEPRTCRLTGRKALTWWVT